MNSRIPVVMGVIAWVLSFSVVVASAQTRVCGPILSRNCFSLAECKQKNADYDACEKNEAAQRRAENARKQQAYERQHQAEIDAVKKVDEVNKALKGAGVPK